MGRLALDVPVVEADEVRHEFADGWIEIVRPGITVMQFYRLEGPADDPIKKVFRETHLPTFAYDATVRTSGMSCIRECQRRVPGLKV